MGKLKIPKNTVLLGRKLYIPKKYIDREILQREYETRLYDEAKCAKCDFLIDRHSMECDTCEHFKGDIILWDKQRIDGKNFIGLPPVHLRKPAELFDLPPFLDIMDIRPNVPMEKEIKFTGKLYRGEVVNGHKTVNQRRAVRKWLKRRSGIIEAPPRAGKTVMGAYITCKLQVKTLIVAHQIDLLNQFYATFCGSEEQTPVTSLKDEPNRDHYIRIVEKISDLEGIEEVEIVLVNYQKFIRDEKAADRVIEYLSNRTLLITDEVHNSAAPAYARFIASLRCPYRLALSATWKRKDARHKIIYEYFGEVLASCRVQGAIPEIYIERPPYQYPNPPRHPHWAKKRLVDNKKRTKFIVKRLKKDLKAGHKLAIIPVEWLDHAKDLQDEIHRQIAPDICRIFSRFTPDRRQLLRDFDNGQFKVLIAIRRMIKEGINLKNPTLLYAILPMSGKPDIGCPEAYQMLQRISTRTLDKRQPVARIFVDNITISWGCFKGLWNHELVPYSQGKHPRYKLPQKTIDVADEIFDGKGNKAKSSQEPRALF
jgi:hypothetical protein